MKTGVVYDPIFLHHVNPQGHPERVERLRAIQAALEAEAFFQEPVPVPAVAATDEDLARIHTPAYIASIRGLAGRDGYLDGDTYFSAESVQAALQAAGGAVALARKVWRGELQNGAALLRPPGHHAEAGRAMGFCIFNNVAIAAAALLHDGAKRVAIFDWDVHHGNGTQHSFEASPDVLYLSTHQYPFYPGTGGAGETGTGAGRGFTVNVPLPAGCGDAEYLTAVDTIVAPVIEQYRPDVLLISAGFDTYFDDPLASMLVTANGFAEMARRMRALAERVCDGKLVYVLEGGYDLEGLSQGMKACIEDLLHPKAPSAVTETPTSAFQNALAAVRKEQADYWKL